MNVRSLWRSLGDWRVPIALLPLAVQETLAHSPENFPGADWRGQALVVLGLVASRWLLPYPRTTFAVLLAVLTLPVAVVYGTHSQPPFTPALVLIVGISVLEAHHADPRARALILLFVGLELTACILQQIGGRMDTGDIWGIWVLVAAALAVGAIVRRRDAENVALRARGEQRARRAAEQERARIARELHDVIAHSVSVMVIQASVEARTVGDPGTREVLASIETTGRQALGELRRLLGILRHDGTPPALEPQPGLDDLPTLADQVRQAGLPVGLDITTDVGSIAPGVELSAYRIVQESLTNALKHARATSATVRVARNGRYLELEVRDDGTGGAAAGTGHGLAGMQERARLYGGEVSATPLPTGGFRVWARLPVEAGA